MAVITRYVLRAGLALCLLAGWSGISRAADRIGEYVVPGSHAAQVKQCVEPTTDMRRYHMELIKHQRDVTVYHGIRGTKHSLTTCIACHTSHSANGTPVPVNAPGQFCNACHAAAAVTVNCFDCHATVPKGEAWNREVAQRQGPHSAEASE